MSDAQAHTMLSSSPAPTDVSQTFSASPATLPCLLSNHLFFLFPSFFFFQATATEDVAESLSPDDGECPHLDFHVLRLKLSVNWILTFLWLLQTTGCILEETSYRTAAASAAV